MPHTFCRTRPERQRLAGNGFSKIKASDKAILRNIFKSLNNEGSGADKKNLCMKNFMA
jgi:hypothetical protein